ncbi:MAG: hypothetical protein IT430_13810 [Phycisphaerales bacterium]|nr:hypothetical protein [Phycisphaerales bacterium]
MTAAIRPMILNADVSDLNRFAPDYLARCQNELCRQIGGLAFFSQGWFYSQWYDGDTQQWHTGKLQLNVFDDTVNRNVGARTIDFKGLCVVDIESEEALGAALRGDAAAIENIRACLSRVRRTFPNAWVGMYGPRLPQYHHTTYGLRGDEWSVLMSRVHDLIDAWHPPLNAISGEFEHRRFADLLTLVMDSGKRCLPYLYWPEVYSIWDYQSDVIAALGEKRFGHALAWDRRLIR